MLATRGRCGAALVAVLWASSLAWAAAGEQPDTDSVPRTGCVVVVVSDTAAKKPMPGAEVVALGTRRGCLADSLGQCRLCGLQVGRLILKVREPRTAQQRYDLSYKWGFQERYIVHWVSAGSTDTLRVKMGTDPSRPILM